MKTLAVSLLMLLSFATLAQKRTSGFTFNDKPGNKQIDLLYNGRLLTAYCFYDSVMKPILFPVNTVSGITITRGWPIDPRPGERADHPHHTGIWLNYEYVNGLDFWNNSTAIPKERRSHYGAIFHQSVVRKEAKGDKSMLEVTAVWKTPDQQALLNESTTYNFSVSGNNFVIDRTTTLTAVADEVRFNDVKDGMFAIRVARELEIPSDEAEVFVDSHGVATTVKAVSKAGATGDYLSSEGVAGNDVWSTRGKWVTMFGTKDNKPVSVTIFDHPDNLGYPTYWHARGYGLFAANPLGQKVFSNGREELNFLLKKNESVTFKYRVVIHEGDLLTAEGINRMAGEFQKQ